MPRKYEEFLLLCMRNRYTDVELYYQIVSQIQVQEMECPYCKSSGNSTKHGKYTRYIVGWHKGKKDCSSLEVIRIRCENCKKTYAFFPPTIVPYLSYGLCFILMVFMRYFQRKMKILQICEKYDISESMLYRWVHLFGNCHKKWLDMLKSTTRIGCARDDEMHIIGHFLSPSSKIFSESSVFPSTITSIQPVGIV